MNKPRLVFVSTRFLFPIDSGGKIRTTQTLRGLKELGKYHIVLLSPATVREAVEFSEEIQTVCDEFEPWIVKPRSRFFNLLRMRFILNSLPIPIRTDWSPEASALVSHAITKANLVVFDFLHAAVLAPNFLNKPSVLFTHNVEAEIFARHIDAAPNPIYRWIWRDQYKKMQSFERSAMSKFDVVVAVSERDGAKFTSEYALAKPFCIPTGVDLEYFSYREPTRFNEVVFCGSMDWLANQDAVGYFLEEIWPLIVSERPSTHFKIIGRNPPNSLKQKALKFGTSVSFTGFVDDVRDHIGGAGVSVIPMRVAGGTRLKVYESMSIGTPIVSTSIGVEGLPINDVDHYYRADDASSFARQVIDLLDNPERGKSLSRNGRKVVEARFSFRAAAAIFQDACDEAVSAGK